MSELGNILKTSMGYREDQNVCGECEHFNRRTNLNTDGESTHYCVLNPACTLTVVEKGSCDFHNKKESENVQTKKG